MRVVIIGNSAAGTGALEAFRKWDRDSPVTVISDETASLYSRCLLSYYMADDIDQSRLAFRARDFHKRLRAKVILGRKVELVDPEKQHVICDDGSKVGYDRLLIATGGSAKLPSNIPSNVDGVFVLRTIADAEVIRRCIHSGKRAVVLGGGLVGMKAAFALRKRGMEVTVVVRSPFVLSQMIDAGAARIVMARLKEHGIETLTGADVSEVESVKRHISAVKTAIVDSKGLESSGKLQPCDLLVVAKGVTPNMQMVNGTEIQCNRGIITNSKMQTSVENIYAAGDVAETYDIATQQQSVNALWTCAMQQGKIAGINMAGRAKDYDGSVGMNSINFPGVDLISFGMVRPPENQGYEVQTDGRAGARIYKKVVLKDNRIKGLVLVNRIDNAGVLLSLLSRKVDVTGIKSELLSDGFNFGRVLGSRGAAEQARYLKASQPTESYDEK